MDLVPVERCARCGQQYAYTSNSAVDGRSIHANHMLIQISLKLHLRVTTKGSDLVREVRGQFPEEAVIELSSEVRSERGGW